MIGQYRSSPIALGRFTSTIGSMLVRRARQWPDHAVAATRSADHEYIPVPWSRFLDDIASLAGFLHGQGIRRGDRVAVFSPNSYGMLVWEMAVTSMGAVSVPIFAGYDVKNVTYILEHAEPKAIYVDGAKRLEIFEECPGRAGIGIVVTREPSRYACLADALKGGPMEAFLKLVAQVKPDHTAFIQYTSGTTGNPKGVMLSHRNIMSQRRALSKIWKVGRDSRFLSYLPWHHSFGGLFERFSALYHGATIYLEDSLGKDLDRLIQNWSLVKPTQFFSVPKIFIELVTESKLAPEVKEILFHPELKFVFTAAAPLPRECGEYFKAQNVQVMEGWGLTETSPCVTLTPPAKERIHSFVGEPIPGCEILTAEDGEILVRGPNIMKGYFKDPERTRRVLDDLGWFHTGDLGEISDYGLRMICRVDGLFKLSNGEKVSSMLVENAITISSRWIQHAIALGTGEEFVGALVFPNFRNLEHWAKEQGRTLPKGFELAQDREIQGLIAAEIQQNMSDFQPKYMEVQAFTIIPKELTLEDGELTPTMKVIRHRVAAKYHEWIEALFHPNRHPNKLPYIVRLKGEDYVYTW